MNGFWLFVMSHDRIERVIVDGKKMYRSSDLRLFKKKRDAVKAERDYILARYAYFDKMMSSWG